MFVIGHRGAAGCEPENTLRAVRKGMGCAQYIEVDARLSHDRVPIIMHDMTIDRTTNGTGRVSELDLAALQMFDAGKGERIPTLDEVLSTVKGHCGLVVELKEPEGNGPILELIRRTTDITIWIVSFHERALREAKQVLPHIHRGLIFSIGDPAILKRAIDSQIAMVLPTFSLISQEMVEEAHQKHLLVASWTLNHEEEIRAAHLIKADGFVTDYPCWAEKVMMRLGLSSV